jgi:hypothetical protein
MVMIIRPVALEKPASFGPVYQYIYALLSGKPWLIYTTYLLLIVTEALLLQLLVARFRLISFNNYLVVFLWQVLIFSIPQIASVNPVLIAGLITTWSLFKLFDLSSEENTLPNLFTVGFLLSLASLIYGLMIWYFIPLILALFILSLINWREIVVVIVSFFLPYLYLFVYGFVSGTSYDFFSGTDSVALMPEFLSLLRAQWAVFVTVLLLIMLVVFSLVDFFMNFLYKLIQIRNYVTVLTLLLVFSIILDFFSGYWWLAHAYLIFIPLVILFAMSLADRARSRLANILLYLIVVFEIVQVYYLHYA